MPLFCFVEQADSVWAAHVASFGKLYEFHSLKTGSPGDFAQLGPKLASSEGFRLDFSDLVRTVRDREGGRLSAGEMLTIVGFAVGGPGIAAAEMELVEASGLVQVMLAGVGGWRDPWADHRGVAEDASALDEGGGGERGLPRGERAEREDEWGGEGEVSPEMRETLARLELANVQLRIYLDDIDRRIGRIEPNLDDLRAVVRSSGELLQGRGAPANVEGAVKETGRGGEEGRWRADEAMGAELPEVDVGGVEPEIAAARVEDRGAGEVAEGPKVVTRLDGAILSVGDPAPPLAAPVPAAAEPLTLGRVRESSGVVVAAPAVTAEFASALEAVTGEAAKGRGGWVWGALAAVIVLLAGAGVGGAAYLYRQTPQKDGGGRAAQTAEQAEAQGPGSVASGTDEAATGDSGGAGVGGPARDAKGASAPVRVLPGRAPVARTPDEPRPAPVEMGGGVATAQPGSDGSKSLSDGPNGLKSLIHAEARPSVLPPGTSSGEGAKVDVAAVTAGAVSRDRVEGARAAEVVRAPRVEDLRPAAAVDAGGSGGAAAAPVERAATVVRAAAIAPPRAGGGSGAGDVPRAPAGRVGLSTVSTGGTLLSAPAPIYPAQARQLGAEGKVVVRATVNGEGLVTGVQVVDGPGLFRQSAEDAVRRRRYAPFLVGGTPTPFQTVVTLIYRRDR